MGTRTKWTPITRPPSSRPAAISRATPSRSLSCSGLASATISRRGPSGSSSRSTGASSGTASSKAAAGLKNVRSLRSAHLLRNSGTAWSISTRLRPHRKYHARLTTMRTATAIWAKGPEYRMIPRQLTAAKSWAHG